MGSNPSAHQGAAFADADDLPVEQVSWEDCQIFIRELNERVQGGGFRLPTEAEWEFAAGGEENKAVAATAPRSVLKGKPNRLGLVDMLGNVSEWSLSLYLPYPYRADDGREDPSAVGYRVLRGGSFIDSPALVNSSVRHGDRPDRRFAWNGVRVARDIPGGNEAK